MKPQLIQVLEAEKSDSLPIMKDVRSFYGMAQSDLSSSNIKIIKVPNNESDFQKQLDKLRQQLDLLTSEYVQVYQEDTDGDNNTDGN